MSNLPIKQLKINDQAFIPYSDTLVGDEDNKVYKKITDGSGERLVELVSTTDLDSKLDKNNGVATGRLKVKASDTEVPGIMVTTAGDNEDRWFSKLTQDQIEARREYNKESEIYEFFDNENGNKIARHKDVILLTGDQEKTGSITLKSKNDGSEESILKLTNFDDTGYTPEWSKVSLSSRSISAHSEFLGHYNSYSDSIMRPGSISISYQETAVGDSTTKELSISNDSISKNYIISYQGQEQSRTSYTYSFPDKTGTLALKEDITDIASELTKLDENGTYQIKDLVKIINELLGLLGAREHTIDL